MTSATPTPTSTSVTRGSGGRRVLVSSFVGSVVEWYDFLLYGTASALVFPHLFFPSLDTATATLASFGTLAVGYVARPVGGVVFGHFGDRIGRKSMLVMSMVLMGAATVVIGLLPTYQQIGIWAPVLLIMLRLVQGFAVGGEWGGAVLMTLEHARASRRGLWSSVAQMGAPAGLLLSSVVFAMFAALPPERFLAWGWRVPFLLTVVLIGVGLWIRLQVQESPVFRAAAKEAAETTGRERRLPLVDVLRRQPREVAIATLIALGPFAANSVLISFLISYASQVGYSHGTAINGLTVASAASFVALPLFAALSDKIGRKPVYVTGALLLAANSFLLFHLVNTGSTALFILGFVIALVVHAMMYGPMGAFISELFGTRHRYTGASLGYQLASTFGGGLAPLAAAGLLEAAGGAPHTILVAVMMAGCCVITALAALVAGETARTDLVGER